MKTKVLILMLLTTVLCSCNKDVEQTPGQTENGKLRLYGVKTVPNVLTKGTAQKTKLWYPGVDINIKFIDGTTAMHNEVKTIAAEWLKHAGIGFNYVTAPAEADVRITFGKDNERYVTWSYTGTDCKFISNQNEATMNFAYWNDLTAEEKKGDVLRAFGQMLGLELEHRHLELEPTWGAKIEGYWTLDITDIPWEKLRKYVFDPIAANNVISTTNYDPASIMIWPFIGKGLVTYPAGYVVPKAFNTKLSANDIEFIGKLYPISDPNIDPNIKPDYGEATVLTIVPGADAKYINTFNFSTFLSSTEAVVVDLGNGNVFEGLTANAPTVNYEVGTTYAVKIWAKDLGIKISTSTSNTYGVEKVHFSKNTRFTEIYFISCRLSEITFNEPPDFSSIEKFGNTFAYCTWLKTVPSGLFDKAINAKQFGGTFRGTSITSIPVGLFDKCTEVTSFHKCFTDCTSIESIPADLFSKNTKVTAFNSCFSVCQSLSSIPAGLFEKNTEVENFEACFRETKITSIPAGLFDNCPKVTSVGDCFFHCIYLESMPAGLFDKCTDVINFNNCFQYCSNLKTLPAGLFDTQKGPTYFQYVFSNCDQLEGTAPNLWDRFPLSDGMGCFSHCRKLSNYGAIPVEWGYRH